MLTDKNNDISDAEIIEKANRAIIKELGVSGYMRYLRLRHIDSNGKDYIKEQEEFYNNMTVEELSQIARKHWKAEK